MGHPGVRPSANYYGRWLWVPAQGRDDGESVPLLRRRVPLRPPDIARRIAEPLDHDRGQILRLAGDARTRAHGVAVLMFEMRGRLALLQRAGALHHQFAEMQDAEIGWPEMFAGAVGDPALAVL